MKKHSVKIASGMVLVGALSGCSSLVTDHGLDYQDAEASSVELSMPDDAQPVRDKLIIPNEDRIANLETKGEFTAPRAPLVFQPLAYTPLVMQGSVATLTLPVETEEAQTLISEYLSSIAQAHEQTLEFEVSEDTLQSSSVSFEETGTLTKIWYAVTKLEKPTYRFNVEFDEGTRFTKAKVTVTQTTEDAPKAVDYEKNERLANVLVDMWTSFASELEESKVLLSSQTAKAPVKDNSLIWMRSNGELALYLGPRFSERSFKTYINSSDGVFLTGDNDQELSVVPEEQLAKVGDIIDFNLPIKASSDSDGIKLFKVRRRNLDDVEWHARSYPYRIEQQQDGYFLTVDASATDYPRLTSYRIFSRLAK